MERRKVRKNQLFKLWFLRDRFFQFVLAVGFSFVQIFNHSKWLSFFSFLLFFEGFLSQSLRFFWWNAEIKVKVVSNWEKKALLVGSALFLILLFQFSFIFSAKSVSKFSIYFLFLSSFVFFLLCCHAELVKKIQHLTRELMILMPEYDLHEYTHRVDSENEIVRLVNKARSEFKKIRIVAGKNSAQLYRKPTSNKGQFIQIDFSDYNKVISVDHRAKTITVQAGMRQGDLIEAIRAYGWALRALNGSHNLSIGGTVATGSFCASRYTFNEAILSMTVVDACGEVITVDRHNDADVFGAYLCSIGVLGIISTITLQCIDEFYVRGNSEHLSFEQMLTLVDSSGKHFLRDWDYLVCEWYPYIHKVITRRSIQIPKPLQHSDSEISTVGPKESYVAQLFTVIANRFTFVGPMFSGLYLKFLGTDFSDGPWENRICADPALDLSFHPIDYIEVVIPQEHYADYMLDLRQFYREHPNRRPYGPVISDWVIGDDVSWIGKNSTRSVLERSSESATTGAGSKKWFCAVTIMRQHIERKSEAEIFDGPIALGRKYGARMHWGKNPWMRSAAEISKTLPRGNFEKFLELRHSVDPGQIFLNEFLTDVFEKPKLVESKVLDSQMLFS